jgi:hypothetical protein
MKPDRTAAERQRQQVRRDRTAGLTRVTVKVPADSATLVRRFAERLRQKAPRKNS